MDDVFVDDVFEATATLPSRPAPVTQRVRQVLGEVKHAYRGRGLPVAHYLHVGKTGGTALKDALRPVATSGAYRLDLHGHRFTLADVPDGEKFFFAVRDPLARFVSGFSSRQRNGRPPSRWAWSSAEARAFERFSTANELAEQIDADRAARDAMRAIVHVQSPYSSWFGGTEVLMDRRRDVLMVLRTDHLDEDFARLLDRIELTGRAALPSDDRRSHRGRSDTDRALSARAVENLRRWYAADIEFVACCESLADEL